MNTLNHGKIILTGGFLCLTAFSCNSDKSVAKKNDQPNVIFIMADDLGYGDLSCYGQEKFETPAIDALAASGMKFTRHYSGSTVCAPSRSVLLTGLHGGRTPSRGNKRVKPLGQYPLPDSSYTVAELFKEAGYITGAYGKWGLGSAFNSGDPQKQGFDHYYGHYCQSFAHRYYPDFLWDDGKKIFLNNEDSLRDYSADMIHDKALEFIKQYSDTSFFLYLPYTIPHAELILPEDEVFESNRGEYLPEKEFKGNDYFTEEYNPYAYASQDEGHAAFVSMVQRLDRYIDDITATLDDSGILENTLIIFTSDNGPHQEAGADPEYFNSNGGLRGIKRDLYEGGIRVPFIVSWPGVIEEKSSTNHISVFYDLLPTMADLLNIELKVPTDGISYLPVLMNEEQPKHEYLYWEFLERGGKQAVLLENHKAIRLNVHDNPDAPIEVYDLEADPGETRNIADNQPGLVHKADSLMKLSHQPSEDFPFRYERKN